MENEELKTKNEKKAKKEKVKKPAKKFPAKKLPGLFKKSYSQKKFEKILKKIYVPEDKAKITAMFSEKIEKKDKEFIRVPRDSEYTKAELKSLKLLAKNIKQNKGRIKLVPFIAVACFIAAIGITVTIFKNPVAKWGIRSAMQGIFGAKCDIASVKVEIFGAQITVNHLEQANPDEPMKNIFQFDKLDLDFNLTQLLRARFNAQNIEITGIALGTDRKTSGALPVKQKSAKEKEEKNDSTGFYDALKARTGNSVEGAKASITELLAQYDPQTLIANVKDNIKTKEVAAEVEAEIKKMIEAWQSKPAEIQSDVESFKTNSEKLAKLDAKNLKSPAEIQEAITSIQSALDSGKKVKESLDSTVKSFETDKNKVSELKSKVEEAIASDKELIKSQIPDLSVSNAKNVLSGIFDDFAYSMLGKYYPYLKQAISYASSMKNNNSSSESAKESVKKEKKKARKESKRYAGRNVYWRADRVPKLLIENLHGSGSGIDILATNISSDMDKVGKPLVAKGVYSASSRTHNAGLTIDARSASTEPLLTGTYSGDKFPVNMTFGESIEKPGVPSFNGTTSLSAKLTANEDYSFTVGGSLAMNPVTISTQPITPEFANRIYSGALSAVKSMNIGANVAFSEKNGLDLDISTDADKVIMDALKKLAAQELDSVKQEAIAKVTEELNSYTAGLTTQFGDFNEIASKLKDSQSVTEELNKQLESKKEELTKQLTSAATNAATEAATKALGNSEAGKAASNAASNLLKGFGR